MTLSEVAERVREGQCIRGCVVRESHFASCVDYGKESADATCQGCAPRPVATASVVCTKCFGQMAALLRDVPDLVGRVRSLSDPTKAMLIAPVKTTSSNVEAPAPVSADLIDAADVVLSNLRAWALHIDHAAVARWSSNTAGIGALSAFNLALQYSRVISKRLPELTADPEATMRLADALLVRHPEVEGLRPTWSVTDVMDKWRIKRRDGDRYIFQDVEDREISATPVREYYDPLLSIKDAATRVGKTPQAIRKWTASKDLPIATRLRGPRGTVMIWVKASDVDRVAAEMEQRRSTGRPPHQPTHRLPTQCWNELRSQ